MSRSDTEAAILTLRIIPRASRDTVVGEHDGAIKIRLQAPPVDGKANTALIRFIASALDIPKRDVTILSGDTARTKRVRIAGISVKDARRRLLSK